MTSKSSDTSLSKVNLARPFGLLLLVAVGLFLTIGSATPVTNPDTYFHLRMGQEFLDGWAIRSPGTVTGFATADWLPSQWLGQVGFAAMASAFGLPGVAWLTGLLVLTYVAVLYVSVRTRVGPLVSALLVAVTAFALLSVLSGRPQVVSYTFTAILLAAWTTAYRTRRLPWWILLIVWVWPLVHGMWVLGIVISSVAVIGILASDHELVRRPWPWLALPALSVVLSALTPLGLDIYRAALRVGSISQHFAEWAPPDFTKPTTAAAGLLVGALVLLLIRSHRASWFIVALTLLTCAFLAWSNRTVPIAATMAAVLIADHVSQHRPRPVAGRLEKVVVTALFVSCLMALGVLAPRTTAAPVDEGNEARASVHRLPAGTPLLNQWGNGGVDMWHHPHLEIVMHGYGDMFTDDELDRNLRLLRLDPGWTEDLEKLGTTEALLNEDDRLAHALEDLLGWEVVAKDDTLVHLRAPRTEEE